MSMLLVNVEKDLGVLRVRAAFPVEAGSTIVLWGESGAGKSTILSMIAGILRPDRGEISLGGELLFSSNRGRDLPPRSRRIGYVFQDYALFPHLSALGNLVFALGAGGRKGRGKAELAEEATALLERFSIAGAAGRRPRELSGGERQRLAFARALAIGPRLLLLDEPWSALDRRTRAEMHRGFRRFQEETRLTTVLVTHDRSEAELFGRDIHEVHRGEVVLS